VKADGKEIDVNYSFDMASVDVQYLKTLGMELNCGRDFEEIPDEENKVVASFDLPNTPWFNKWWYTTNEHTKLLEALEEDGETGMNLFIEEIRRRFEE
jgi:hypothetical protein